MKNHLWFGHSISRMALNRLRCENVKVPEDIRKLGKSRFEEISGVGATTLKEIGALIGENWSPTPPAILRAIKLLKQEGYQVIPPTHHRSSLLMDQLHEALHTFTTKHPELFELRDGIYAGSYMEYERIFSEFCAEFPQFGGSLLCLYGHRSIYPNRFIPRVEPDPDATDWLSLLLRDKGLRDDIDKSMLRDSHVEHVVWLFPGDHVVDVTYRHLDVFFQQPYHIQTLEELKQIWYFIAPSRSLLEHFTQIDASLSQSTRKSYDKARRAEERSEARRCYDVVAAAFAEGIIYLPGTADDNPHLKSLIETWPALLAD